MEFLNRSGLSALSAKAHFIVLFYSGDRLRLRLAEKPASRCRIYTVPSTFEEMD